ncbi:MAG: GNAT family N-acetyltransferase [Pseudomonadota bacterium]
MIPDAARLHEALEATWPAAGGEIIGPFHLRRGEGGGQRVSAATWSGSAGLFDARTAEDWLPKAQAKMSSWGQPPLFRLREDEVALDTYLDDRAYVPRDATRLLAVSVAQLLTQDIPPTSVFPAPVTMAICREFWREGGVTQGRMAVIDRAPPPAIALLGRHEDTPAGVGLAAIDGKIAMVHALYLRPAFRRQGVARHMMHQAAQWAASHGAETLAVAVVAANAPAVSLFQRLGMVDCGGYQYRVAPEPG